MIGIRFAPDPKTVKKMLRQVPLHHKPKFLRFRDETPNYEVSGQATRSSKTRCCSARAQMHLRGKDFGLKPEYHNGPTSEVLPQRAPHEFNGKLRYIFAEPKLLPNGTALHLTDSLR